MSSTSWQGVDSPLQISAWKLRGNLPHAVESTWLLTEAVLADGISAERMPIFAVKAAYITAISRCTCPRPRFPPIVKPPNRLPSFVTGLLDSQQESKYKVSMYTKAQQIGLPALFVDLRHESTHGDMPSLANLRSAAQRALHWLWDDYWSKLGEGEKVQAKESLAGSIDNGANPSVSDTSDQVDDKAKGSSERHKDAASEPMSEVASWSKWQGHWVARPIGTIDIH